MQLTHKTLAISLSISSIGFLAAVQPAKADYPGISYWQRPISTTVQGCLRRASRVMRNEGVSNVAVKDGNTVWGNTSDLKVGIGCFNINGQTTALIILAGDDVTAAEELRNALRDSL